MKNREKYADFLLKCAVNNTVSFGVDRITGEPKFCSSSSSRDEIKCTNCRFGTVFCGEKARSEWLEEEVDDWADFRDLQRGEIIMINNSGQWYPVIFVRFDEFGLRYSRCISNSGQFVCAVEFEDDPKRVKKAIKEELI